MTHVGVIGGAALRACLAATERGADRINGSGIMEALVLGALAGAYARESRHGLDRLTGWRRQLQAEMDDVLAMSLRR